MKLNDHSDAPLPRLAARELTSHKGDFGHALVVGGSRDMAGAAAIVGLAALRSGAGLVTIATARSAQAIVASFSPCYMTRGLDEADDGTLSATNVPWFDAQRDRFDAWALGPGLGRSVGATALAVHLIRSTTRPLVVDADGLNAMASVSADASLLEAAIGPRILTPHGGEFMRLTGESLTDAPTSRAAQAAALCRRDATQQTVVVLKGHQTIVCDGQRFAVNSTGNPGMASGGSGDCLTGVLAALLGQGLSAWDAARLGAYAHGLAGDLAADALGETALVATDIIAYLPQAWLQLAQDEDDV